MANEEGIIPCYPGHRKWEFFHGNGFTLQRSQSGLSAQRRQSLLPHQLQHFPYQLRRFLLQRFLCQRFPRRCFLYLCPLFQLRYFLQL